MPRAPALAVCSLKPGRLVGQGDDVMVQGQTGCWPAELFLDLLIVNPVGSFFEENGSAMAGTLIRFDARRPSRPNRPAEHWQGA
jgi:hypothetical protein